MNPGSPPVAILLLLAVAYVLVRAWRERPR